MFHRFRIADMDATIVSDGPHRLYACHDLLLPHKDALFGHLMARWRDLFNANFDVLLYDLTSTYPRVKPEGMLRDQRLRRGGGRQAPPRPAGAVSGGNAERTPLAP